MMSDFGCSWAWYTESKRYLAGGVSSSLRASMRPVPLFARRGEGAYLWDEDGNVYIDYLLAYGPLILGHAHPAVVDRMDQTARCGLTYGLQHKGEVELSKRLTQLVPCAEMVAFAGSGTEAVMLALRLARAFTGRQKVVRFHGHYHGWSDSIFTSFPGGSAIPANADEFPVPPGTAGQSLNGLRDLILVPWNDFDALERVMEDHPGEIAAVITEPVMCNSGCILPLPGYLQHLRDLTRTHGTLLIFDEVITGFRLGLAGAQGHFGVCPDLGTFGKAIAGGMPLSAVCGRRDIMELIASGTVSHLGTFNGNCMAVAAANATLDVLSADNGRIYQEMSARAVRLARGLTELLHRRGIPGLVNQIGPVLHLMFTNRDQVRTFEDFLDRDTERYSQFAEGMLYEGILLRQSGLWYLSGAHGDAEVDRTLEAADRVLGKL